MQREPGTTPDNPARAAYHRPWRAPQEAPARACARHRGKLVLTMNMTMQMMEMHRKDLPMQDMDMSVMQECLEAAVACEQACIMCADSMSGQDMSRCVSMCANTADMAKTMVRAMLRPNGTHMESMMAMHMASVTTAAACADECMKHADMSEDARLCAEACRQSAAASQKMMDAMKGMKPSG
jgi:hypothetical protein